MKKEKLTLALEILDLDNKGTEKIRQSIVEGGRLKVLGDRLVLFPVNEELGGMFEEIGVDLSENAEFKLVFYDPGTETTQDASLINDVPDIDLNDGKFDIIDLPDVVSYIVENKEAVEKETKQLEQRQVPVSETKDEEQSKDTEESSDNEESEESKETAEDDELLDDDFDESDLDDELLDDEDTDEDDKSDLNEPETQESDNDDSDVEDDDEDKLDEDVLDDDDLESMFDDLDDDSEDENDKTPVDNSSENSEFLDNNEIKDPLMQEAVAIFNKATVGEELPVFDTQTRELIAQGLAEAGGHLTRARHNAIQRIYNLLKSNHEKELKQAESTTFADAQQSHDKNIEQIKSNENVMLSKIENEEKANYESRKKAAGKAVLDEFYTKYDQKHLGELHKLIEEQSVTARANTKANIEIENEDYDQYLEKAKKAVYQHVIDHANVDDIVNDYKQVVDDEKKRLVEEARKANDENKRLQEKINSLENALTIQKETADSRVKAEVAQQVNQATHKYLTQVDDEIKKRKEAEKQAQAKIDAALAESEKVKQDAQSKINAEVQKRLDAEKKIEEKQHNIEKQQDKISNLASKLADTTQELQEKSVLSATRPSSPRTKNANHKSSALTKALLGIGLTIFGVGLGFGGYTMLTNQNQQVQQESKLQSSAPTQASSTSQDSKASTFVYTDKNGKKYAVIKDDDNSGHYIDDKGNTHTVVFK